MSTLKNIDPRAQASSLWNEFKAFAFKGNVIDMAVGVIIGTAFGAIVKSLVDHIIMPLIGVILPGEQGYVGWTWNIGEKGVPYGQFIGSVVNFLIIALVLFIFIVKFLGWISKSRKQESQEPPPPAPLTKDQELLVEIRDLLKARA